MFYLDQLVYYKLKSQYNGIYIYIYIYIFISIN